MNSRWLSTFTLLGALLLILGLVGLIMQHAGSGFVFDPGQPPPANGQDNTPWYYLVIGALMVLNGLFSPAGESTDKKSSDRDQGRGPQGGVPAGETPVSRPAIKPRTRRQTVVSSSEQTNE